MAVLKYMKRPSANLGRLNEAWGSSGFFFSFVQASLPRPLSMLFLLLLSSQPSLPPSVSLASPSQFRNNLDNCDTQTVSLQCSWLPLQPIPAQPTVETPQRLISSGPYTSEHLVHIHLTTRRACVPCVYFLYSVHS